MWPLGAQSEAIPEFSSLHMVVWDEHCEGPSPQKDAAMGHHKCQEGTNKASKTSALSSISTLGWLNIKLAVGDCIYTTLLVHM